MSPPWRLWGCRATSLACSACWQPSSSIFYGAAAAAAATEASVYTPAPQGTIGDPVLVAHTCYTPILDGWLAVDSDCTPHLQVGLMM